MVIENLDPRLAPPGDTGDAELAHLLAEVEATVAGSSIDDDPAFRRQVFLRLLDWRLRQPLIGATACLHCSESEVQCAETVAAFLGISADAARRLFVFHGLEPYAWLPQEQRGETERTTISVIALLTCAARTALGMRTRDYDVYEAAVEHPFRDDELEDHLRATEGVLVSPARDGRGLDIRLSPGGLAEARRMAMSLSSA